MLIAATNASTTGGSGSGGSSFIFFILLGLGVVWLLMIRPQRKKQKLQQSMQSELSIGDEILTAGGVYGTVTSVGEDEVRVEIAPNVEVRLARRAIAAQLTEHASDATADTTESHDAWADAESGEEKPG